jgi:TPP-dependent pyruvate/acetoin dehydrogenase alpha subunit
VADAIVNLIRAACRVREFDLADAEEMLKYAVRRNLMAAEESERVIAEARAIVQRRAERAAEREKPKKPAAAKPKARTKSRPKGLKRVAKKPGRKKK